jgi:hypothetical protein
MLKDAPMSPTRPSVRGTTLIRTTSETGDVPWQHALNGFGFKGFEVCRRDTVRDAGPDSPGSRQERTRDRVPLDWAQTQTNLGIALEMIGNKAKDQASLQKAVALLRAVRANVSRGAYDEQADAIGREIKRLDQVRRRRR